MSVIEKSEFTPGLFVLNNENNDWGLGQVQSCVNNFITVNFENVGKKVININVINLEIVKENEINRSI